jgi:hypothetical protein
MHRRDTVYPVGDGGCRCDDDPWGLLQVLWVGCVEILGDPVEIIKVVMATSPSKNPARYFVYDYVGILIMPSLLGASLYVNTDKLMISHLWQLLQ